MPDKDAAIPFTCRPGTGTGSRFAIQSRNFDESTGAIKPPTMERTGDSIPAHQTTDPQVGSQVGAVGIEDPSDSVLAPKEYEILSEVGHRPYVA